jgi:hypothetical protein
MVRLLILGAVICAVGGTILGTMASLAIGALVTLEFSRLLILPAALPFAFLTVGPVGLAVGAAAGLAVAFLGTRSLRGRSQRAWLLVGAASGGVFGAACPLVLFLTGWGPFELANALSYGASGLFAGSLCGIALGLIGWQDYGARI